MSARPPLRDAVRWAASGPAQRRRLNDSAHPFKRTSFDAPSPFARPTGTPAQQLDHYGQMRPRQISLADLTSFGHAPLSPEKILELAEYTRVELPHRLARRVKAHSALPYIVNTNPHLAKIHNLYRTSFDKIVSMPPIRSVEDNRRFTDELYDLVRQHSDNIPTLAQGFKESRRFMPDEAITAFLDRAIRSRISIRLIAENHICLSDSSKSRPGAIGIVDLKCSPRTMLRSVADFVTNLCEGTYGRAPSLIVDGDVDATFAYIDVHLEFILTELLKNAFRATAERHASAAELPPVHATISHSPAHHTLSLRIRDVGGGIPPAHIRSVFSYAFTTVSSADEEIGGGDPDGGGGGGGPYATMGGGGGGGDSLYSGLGQPSMQSALGSIAGQGYGLPLSRIYSRYFGGALELVTLPPHGTDVYVVLGSMLDGDAALADAPATVQ